MQFLSQPATTIFICEKQKLILREKISVWSQMLYFSYFLILTSDIFLIVFCWLLTTLEMTSTLVKMSP